MAQIGAADGVTTVVELEAHNAELTKTLAVMQEREAVYQAQVAAAEQVIGQLQMDVNETGSSYEEVLVAYDGSLAELQGQNEELVQSVMRLQAREAGFYADVDVANQAIASLEAQNAELTLGLQGLQGQYETAVTQANQTIAELEAQLNSAYSQNGQLQGLVQAMQAREVEFQAQIAQANQTIQEMQNMLNNQSYGGGYEGEEYEEYEEDDD